MSDLTLKLRAEAARLLAERAVEFVLGHQESPSLPGRCVPCYARTAADAERLVFDHRCQVNLSGLVKLHHRRTKRFAVVAKGCDVRGLLSLMQEKQLKREQVYVIAPVCDGVVDFRRLKDRAARPPAPAEADLEERCRACAVKRPPVADFVLEAPLGAAGALPELPPLAAALERLSLDERGAQWREALSRCIRCHACRRACPVCACASCIFESTTPVWVDRSVNRSDNELYSLVRLWHMAGRCTGCGECERACPAGIPFTTITAHLARDAERLFGQRPGTDPAAKRILVGFDEARDRELADFVA